MICVRRARPVDAAAIGAVHVATWRSAYAGVLSPEYLAGLSALRHAAGYERAIADRRNGHATFVAVANGTDTPPGREDREGGAVVGFASGGRARRSLIGQRDPLGEIETLYLLDDYRDRGTGRRMMRAMAAHLAAVGCRAAMVWVLEANQSRWFYRHLCGRPVARERIRFAGQQMEQVAFVWDPIEALLAATAPAREG